MITNGKRGPASVVESFDSIRADYDMSRDSRFVRKRTGLPYNGGSADWHYRSERLYYNDIEKARDLDRNDAIVGQTVDRAVVNIVQDGFALDTKTGDKRLDADLKARWLAWSRDPEACDIAGESCFHDFEWHSCRSLLVDGDCVNVGLRTGHLQNFEAHTIQTTTRMENTFLGVTKGQYGQRSRYWVMADPVEPARGASQEKSVPLSVRNGQGLRTLFHIYSPRRMSQTRGVTAFAPIFDQAGMFEDILFAKLVQQQVVSCFAVFRENKYNPDLPGSGAQPYGNGTTETTSSGSRFIENISPGMEVIGEPGEELKGFSPAVPNEEFFHHVRLTLQVIGVNLGLPLCLVLMDGSETNFSGWRGAVDEARKGWKNRQRDLIKRLHSPVYRWKVAQWMAEDPALRRAAERSRVDITGHAWNAPRWDYIEPKTDAEGDAVRLSASLTSRRRLHAERGYAWDEISQEIVDDSLLAITQAKKAAAAINKKYPDDPPVVWRELINLPMVDGWQMVTTDPNQVEIAADEANVDLQDAD